MKRTAQEKSNSVQLQKGGLVIVATGHLELHIAKLATRVPKYTIYGNFGTFNPAGSVAMVQRGSVTA